MIREPGIPVDEERARLAFQAGLLQIVEHSVIATDLAGTITYWNQCAEKLFGWRAVEVLGRSISEVLPPASSREEGEEIMKQVLAGEVWSGEFTVQRRDGALLPLEVTDSPIRGPDGAIVGIVGIAHDITKRKRAENELRQSETEQRELAAELERERARLVAAQALAKVGSWETDVRTGKVIWSEESHRIFETDPETVQLTVETVLGFIHDDDRPGVAASFAHSVATGSPGAVEHRVVRADGQTKLVDERWQIVAGEDGQAIRAVGTCQDITERKQSERQIESFAEVFRALSHRLMTVQEEERRHLARELHDEIGQTLTATKLNLKMIAPEVPASTASRLQDSIGLLDRLLHQVRQLSLDLRPPLLDELGLVPALRWLAAEQTQRARLRVSFTSNEEKLELDAPARTACFRVAQEAITNAIRHARATSVTVELRADSDRVWLIVRDDGVGFDKDAMQQRAVRGVSMGLLSMRERVSLLGGELEVNSAPARGTEIRAWLPLIRSDATPLHDV